MINEEPRRKNDPQPPLQNSTPDPEKASEPEMEMFPPEVKSAIDNFEEIKQALIGDKPEWLIPRVDPRALASEP